MSRLLISPVSGSGPSPHGEGGLKYQRALFARCPPRPSPHGEGGLKSAEAVIQSPGTGVPPHTGRVD